MRDGESKYKTNKEEKEERDGAKLKRNLDINTLNKKNIYNNVSYRSTR